MTGKNTMTINEMVHELNEHRNSWTGAELSRRISAIIEAVKEENRERTEARVNELLKLDNENLWKEYLNNPNVSTLRFKEDKRQNTYVIEELTKYIAVTTLEKTAHERTIVNDRIYRREVDLFTDNLNRFAADGLSEDGQKVMVPSLNSKNTEYRKEYVDFGASSISALEKQLNAIMYALLPQSISIDIKMVKADVKYILHCMTSEDKRSSGGIAFKNEAYVLSRIIVAIKTRMNNKAYTIRSSASCHKDDNK